MPLSSGLSIHDDTKHKGSAKRDTANGVAPLDASGNVEDEAGNDCETTNNKGAVSGYAGLNADSKVVSRLAYEGVANGIAGLDASVEIPVALLKTNVANGIAGLDANIHILAERLERGILQAVLWQKAASNDLRNSHDAIVGVSELSWTKKKTITLTDGILGTLRIKFNLYNLNAPTTDIVYGRVYKNGVAIGTIQSNSDIDMDNTYSEDINVGEMQEGDTLELWCYVNQSPDQTECSWFRLYYANSEPVTVASSNS